MFVLYLTCVNCFCVNCLFLLDYLSMLFCLWLDMSLFFLSLDTQIFNAFSVMFYAKKDESKHYQLKFKSSIIDLIITCMSTIIKLIPVNKCQQSSNICNPGLYQFTSFSKMSTHFPSYSWKLEGKIKDWAAIQ